MSLQSALPTVVDPAPKPSAGSIEELDAQRLTRVKAAYTTRFAAERIAQDPAGYRLLTGDGVVPQAGDIVLAEVLELGQHLRIERPDSRRAVLFEGDEILVAYGARYAPDQFESVVPTGLAQTDLAAAGGVAGDVVAAHFDMDLPTRIRPLGLLVDSGGIVTLRRCAPHALLSPDDIAHRQRPDPKVLAVLGTSMNSGKTTTAAAITRGLAATGLRVGAGKVTGTGAGGDPRLFEDSGADVVLDFTDFGYASTYGLPHHEVRTLLVSIADALTAGGAEVIVLEVADGLFQQETARLVDDAWLADCVDTVVFAAAEAMGALAGRDHLVSKGFHLVAVSGRVTASPLAKSEAASALDVPVLDVDELASGDLTDLLLGRVPAAGDASPGVRAGA